MTSYTKSTNFATKDTLTSGDPLKIVKGTEINTEFDNIQSAVNSKSDTASPTFTGTVTIPTASVSNTTDSSSVSTGSIITAGGIGIAKSAYVGTTLNVAGNTVLGDASTDTLNVGNGGLVKDASGNVGVGVTPSAFGSGFKALQMNGGSLMAFGGTNMYYLNNTYFDGTNYKYVNTGFATNYVQSSGIHTWSYAPSGTAGNNITFTEAMRIDTSGNLLVGANSGGSTGVAGIVKAVGYNTKAGTSASLNTNNFNINFGTGAQLWIDSTNLGTFSFTSDYRIKKDIQTQTLSALNRILQLRPVTYEFGDYKDLFKADGIAREGFIAHELQAVIPSAVDGEKDAEDQIQSLRLDALCSVLVKAIQEMKAIIDTQASTITTLTDRITALENK
jgi:hypothetical protein